MSIRKIIKKIFRSNFPKCSECREVYKPASAHADVRCANCGCHQAQESNS